MAAKEIHVSEQEAMKVAEASRQTEWKQPSFMRELFLGNFRLDLIHPFPLEETERPEFTAFYNALKEFLRDHVDSEAIDESGEYPEDVVDGLRKLGAFGMKIPKKYGGLGFNQLEYGKVMELLGRLRGQPHGSAVGPSVDRRAAAPEGLRLGRPRRRSTCRAAPSGEISAFALTEPQVGSDPARLQHHLRARRRPLRPERREAVVHQRHSRRTCWW